MFDESDGTGPESCQNFCLLDKSTLVWVQSNSPDSKRVLKVHIDSRLNT